MYPEIGSRWYVWGEHYEVVEIVQKDVPHIRLRRIKDRKLVLPAVLDAFQRRAVPSNA